jgi:hypothetical protein
MLFSATCGPSCIVDSWHPPFPNGEKRQPSPGRARVIGSIGAPEIGPFFSAAGAWVGAGLGWGSCAEDLPLREALDHGLNRGTAR